MIIKTRLSRIVSAILSFSAILLSLYYYIPGILHSPVFNPELIKKKHYTKQSLAKDDKEYQQEKLLAEGYWKRYVDVGKSSYWGKSGAMGIWGPRDHYKQHGKREGRIFAPLHSPANLNLEARLAEKYWRDYPEIAKDSIWGRKGALGILGPRDHFRYRGRFQGKTWPSLTPGEKKN
jgi:hypothetical protein